MGFSHRGSSGPTLERGRLFLLRREPGAGPSGRALAAILGGRMEVSRAEGRVNRAGEPSHGARGRLSLSCREEEGKESSRPRKLLGSGVASLLPFRSRTALTGQKRSQCPDSRTRAGLWDPPQHILGCWCQLGPFTGCPGRKNLAAWDGRGWLALGLVFPLPLGMCLYPGSFEVQDKSKRWHGIPAAQTHGGLARRVSEERTARVLILDLPLSCWAILGKLLPLSVPCCPRL